MSYSFLEVIACMVRGGSWVDVDHDMHVIYSFSIVAREGDALVGVRFVRRAP